MKKFANINPLDIEKIEKLEQNISKFQKKSSKIFVKSKTILDKFNVSENLSQNKHNANKFHHYENSTNEEKGGFSSQLDPNYEKDAIINQISSFTAKKTSPSVMPGLFCLR